MTIRDRIRQFVDDDLERWIGSSMSCCGTMGTLHIHGGQFDPQDDQFVSCRPRQTSYRHPQPDPHADRIPMPVPDPDCIAVLRGLDKTVYD